MTVICGVDGSAPAHDAGRLSAALARDLGHELVLLRIDRRSAAERLAAAARRAAFVAVAGRAGAMVTGGLPATLARRSSCPVVVVPPGARLGGDVVLCGVRDWSDLGTALVAARLAAAIRLPLTLAHVLPSAVGPAATVPAPPPAVGVLDRPADPEAAGALLRAVAAPPRTRIAAALAGSASAHLMRRGGLPVVVCPAAVRRILPRAG